MIKFGQQRDATLRRMNYDLNFVSGNVDRIYHYLLSAGRIKNYDHVRNDSGNYFWGFAKYLYLWKVEIRNLA